MKSSTLWRRQNPLFEANDEDPAREERREFRPKTLAPVAHDRGEPALTQRRNRAPRLKVGRPSLRVLPDPLETGAGTQSIGHAISLYVREIGEVKPLGPEKEAQLIAQIRRGDQKAREHLIKGNLRRVAEICREYENIGLSQLDLISEGNLGLLKAVERFEPAKGTCFADFSTWWIKQSIKRALARSS